MIHLHGGGWVFGNSQGGASFFSRACVEARCVVVSVDYRLAPENPFPSGVDDAWDTLCWVVGEGKGVLGVDVSRVTVGGVSAGGNLAAVVAQRASVAGIPLILQLLTVPYTNATYSPANRSQWSASMLEHEDIFGLNVRDVFWFFDLYAPDPQDRLLPEVSPLLQDDHKAYERMAPAIVSVMELDVLFTDGEAYAHKMRDFGVDVTLKKYLGVTHVNVSSDRVCDMSRIIGQDRIEALKVAFARSFVDAN